MEQHLSLITSIKSTQDKIDHYKKLTNTLKKYVAEIESDSNHNVEDRDKKLLEIHNNIKILEEICDNAQKELEQICKDKNLTIHLEVAKNLKDFD